MCPELIEDLLLELKLLRGLLAQCAPLRDVVADATASETEKLAAASLLQSFYNGVERVFDLLAERLDGDRPAGADRHERLLTQMAAATDARPAVIGPELREGLSEYLEFRNAYRYGHYFRLDWPLMASLVDQSSATLDRLEAELDAFVREHVGKRFLGRDEPEGLPEYWFATPAEPPAPAGRLRLVGLLAGLAGVILGAGTALLVQHLRRAAPPAEAPAHEMRALAASLARQIVPWRGDPQIHHVHGVLEFFDRPDWRFVFAADHREGTGSVTGRCASLDAAAELVFARGRLARIDLSTAWEKYVFSVSGGRLTRAAQYAMPAGRVRQIAEFGPAGEPVYLAAWQDGDRGPMRRERFYRQGQLLLDTVSLADGAVERLTVRTGSAPDAAAIYAAATPGPLAHDPNATTNLADLPTPN